MGFYNIIFEIIFCLIIKIFIGNTYSIDIERSKKYIITSHIKIIPKILSRVETMKSKIEVGNSKEYTLIEKEED